MSDLTKALDSAYARLGEDASFQAAAGGAPATVRVMRPDPDPVLGGHVGSGDVFVVRVSEVAAPVVNDTLTIPTPGGQDYVIQAAPVHNDGRRLEWRLDCAEA